MFCTTQTVATGNVYITLTRQSSGEPFYDLLILVAEFLDPKKNFAVYKSMSKAVWFCGSGEPVYDLLILVAEFLAPPKL